MFPPALEPFDSVHQWFAAVDAICTFETIVTATFSALYDWWPRQPKATCDFLRHVIKLEDFLGISAT